MSFRVNSTDLKHGTEIKESVATAEEEFKNNTAGETDRKLVPKDEEEFKKTRTEKLKRKLIPEDEEELKNSRVEESIKPAPAPILPSGVSARKKKLKLKCLNSAEDLTVFYKGLEDDFLFSSLDCEIRPTINPYLEDKDDEEDKEISRTQSMDNLALMQKP